MKALIWTSTIVISLAVSQAFSQTCEDFKRNLFHGLPQEVPNRINCKDSLGQREGWWIFYKVDYNPVDKPDELRKGDYVDVYTYGKYESDRKIGQWTTINNVHMIYEIRVDSFYYKEGSTFIKSWFLDSGPHDATLYYSRDSSVIKYSVANHKRAVKIECDKSGGQFEKSCKMTYRNAVIKVFPHDRFEMEREAPFFKYETEMNQIDERLR
jgi:hypothetical protein